MWEGSQKHFGATHGSLVHIMSMPQYARVQTCHSVDQDALQYAATLRRYAIVSVFTGGGQLDYVYERNQTSVNANKSHYVEVLQVFEVLHLLCLLVRKY